MLINIEEDTLREFYANLISKFGEDFLRRALDSGSTRNSRDIIGDIIGNVNDKDEQSDDSVSLVNSSYDDETNIKNYINVLLFGDNLDFNLTKLYRYFDTINSEKDYVFVNNSIISTDMINKETCNSVLKVLSENY